MKKETEIVPIVNESAEVVGKDIVNTCKTIYYEEIIPNKEEISDGKFRNIEKIR
jgi:hypothetical protein